MCLVWTVVQHETFDNKIIYYCKYKNDLSESYVFTVVVRLGFSQSFSNFKLQKAVVCYF